SRSAAAPPLISIAEYARVCWDTLARKSASTARPKLGRAAAAIRELEWEHARGQRPLAEDVTTMPPALHIFDCDGVLVDSEVIVTRIESQLLRNVGVELTPASIAEAFVGLSEAEMHGRIEADCGAQPSEDFGSRKAALLAEVIRT